MGEGRDEYATSEALGAASADMAAAAVRSVAAGAAEFAAAKAMGGMSEALASDSAHRAVRARGAGEGRASKPPTRAAAKRAPGNPAKPKM